MAIKAREREQGIAENDARKRSLLNPPPPLPAAVNGKAAFFPPLTRSPSRGDRGPHLPVPELAMRQFENRGGVG